MKLFDKLIEQSRNPQGFLGYIMLKMMNVSYFNISKAALKELNPGNRVLDIGCGGGQVLSLLAKNKNFSFVVGIDTSKTALQLSEKKNHLFIKKGIMKIIHAEVENLPFENSCFDAVTCFNTHFHWQNLIAGLSEIRRVLKANGQLLIVAEYHKLCYHLQENNNNGTEQLLRQMDFNITSSLQRSAFMIIVAEKKQD